MAKRILKKVFKGGNEYEVGNIKAYSITESDVSVATDSTMGVAPYDTSYGYTGITINDSAGIKWKEGAIYCFVINSTMVVASATRNVRVRIGTSGSRIPVMDSSGTILVGSSYFTKSQLRFFVYKTTYQSTGALHMATDSNTTYSAMSVAEGQTGTATTARSMRADRLKSIIKYHAVDDTAYASSRDGKTDIAPSKNAVYDKISSLDTNKANDSDVIKKTATSMQNCSVSGSGATTALALTSNTTSSYIALNGSNGFLGSYGVDSNKNPVFYNGSSFNITTDTKLENRIKGTIKKVNTYERTYASSTWASYGTPGLTDNYSIEGYDNSHLNAGDLIMITGTITDKVDDAGNNVFAAIIGTMTSKTSTQVYITVIGLLTGPAASTSATSVSITLNSSSWDANNQQTITVSGMTSSAIVIVSPAPSNIQEYIGTSIYCSAQGTNSLTFTCGKLPDDNISVNVVIMK